MYTTLLEIPYPVRCCVHRDLRTGSPVIKSRRLNSINYAANLPMFSPTRFLGRYVYQDKRNCYYRSGGKAELLPDYVSIFIYRTLDEYFSNRFNRIRRITELFIGDTGRGGASELKAVTVV